MSVPKLTYPSCRRGYRRRSIQRYSIGKWTRKLLMILLISYIPVMLMLTSLHSHPPQAILTLGGRSSREVFTAEFAKQHPELPVWISSGLDPEQSRVFFQAAGIDLTRVHYDQRATDTVTNFTTMVDEFQRRHIRHVYLITSDFHMARARAIATLVFGSRRIAITPVTVPSPTPPESTLRIARDVGRSLVWIVTGRTGARLRDQRSLEQVKVPFSEDL